MDVFIDETSQTKHRYLLLGGLAIQRQATETLDGMIAEIKQRAAIGPEMKWGRVSRYHLPNYMALVDLFFDSPATLGPVEFHSLVVDTHQRNETAFNDGSKEIGFNKEFYQLSMKQFRLYPRHVFHLYPDHRNTPQTTEQTRLILNRGAHKKSRVRDWPFRRLHMRDSSQTLPLQMVDVLLGALAYKINGHDLAPEASDAKRTLAAHVLSRARIKNHMIDTATAGKLTVWHRRLGAVPRP